MRTPGPVRFAAVLVAGLLFAGTTAAQSQLQAAADQARDFAERGAATLRSFDYLDACKWYALAAAFDGSRYRDHFEGVAAVLDDRERARCVAAARAWRPQDSVGDEQPTARDDRSTGYYAGAAGASGEALRSALHAIIRSHRRLSYGEVWDALASTDGDPERPGHVILLYTGRSQASSRRVRGGGDDDAWNREHVWPNSHGFPHKDQAAYSDLHNLRPADVTVNAERGNKDFDNGGAQLSEAPGARADDDSFEPPGAVKGDVARTVFYMDVRYEGGDGVPDLMLAEGHTRPKVPALGRLCTLLAWHRADPVDGRERRRNDRVFELQGNRNPFIDHPEWAVDIWGDRCP